MATIKYICVAKCPELDFDNSRHCTCYDISAIYEQYVDGCPCGNSPIWKPIHNDIKESE